MSERIRAQLSLDFHDYANERALSVKLSGGDEHRQAIAWGCKNRGTRKGGPSDPGWVDAEATAHGLEMLAKWIRSKMPKNPADKRVLL